MESKLNTQDFLDGQVFLINKPYEWTSFDVVKKIRRLIQNNLKIKKIKVGHTGTLDPLATGLMIICTGKATKKITALIENSKEYIAEIELGSTTPSYDLETNVDKHFEYKDITAKAIKEVLSEQFSGKIKQRPPLFSAKRINGVRAYELARKGEKLELDPVEVEIMNIELIDFQLPRIKLQIKCSKGTYIRSLANDLGKALKSGAHLVALERTAIGKYSLSEAITIDQFEKSLLN